MLAQSFMDATTLRITEHEREALIKVLGVLERGELPHTPIADQHPEDAKEWFPEFTKLTGFNMRWYYSKPEHGCGTTACIAGTCDALFGTQFVGRAYDISKELFRLFHCTEATEYASDSLHSLHLRMERITTEEAAQALRNYLTCNDPQWWDIFHG